MLFKLILIITFSNGITQESVIDYNLSYEDCMYTNEVLFDNDALCVLQEHEL